MSYKAVFEKKGLKAKDVDFAKIGTSIQIQVPPTVVATLKKKIEGAQKPFDLIIELDADSGKYRVVLKKLTPTDTIVDWTDPLVRFQKDATARVKQELVSWQQTVVSYQDELDVVAQKVKAGRDLLKELESTPNDPRVAAEIASLKQTLTRIEAEGEEIKHRFDTWYSGPRAGVAGLFKTFKVDQAKLDKGDSDAFHVGVMELSKNANTVLNAYKMNVEGPVKALLARLDNFTSVATKSQSEALSDVRASVAAQVQTLQTDMGGKLAALKIEATVEFGKQFKERKGISFDRYKNVPGDLTARIAAVKNQLISADANLALMEKTASRIMKSIPAAFLKDPEVMKNETRLSTMVVKFKKDIAEGKVQLTAVNNILDAYLKGAPARPAGPVGNQAANAKT